MRPGWPGDLGHGLGRVLTGDPVVRSLKLLSGGYLSPSALLGGLARARACPAGSICDMAIGVFALSLLEDSFHILIV